MPTGVYPRPSLAKRFWAKVRIVNDGLSCWTWAAATNGVYGIIQMGRSNMSNMRYAHRVAYALTHGSIREGMDVLHTCDNPVCVRPSHLFEGTQLDNMRDMVRKGRGRNGKL